MVCNTNNPCLFLLGSTSQFLRPRLTLQYPPYIVNIQSDTSLFKPILSIAMISAVLYVQLLKPDLCIDVIELLCGADHT
jgi:hypothetical protein